MVIRMPNHDFVPKYNSSPHSQFIQYVSHCVLEEAYRSGSPLPCSLQVKDGTGRVVSVVRVASIDELLKINGHTEGNTKASLTVILTDASGGSLEREFSV